MNLYELFDNATDNLAELPDLAPVAERIVRRRRITTRSFSAACAAALVIGVGTLTLHPDSPPLPATVGGGPVCGSAGATASASASPNPGYSLPSSAGSGGATGPGFTGSGSAGDFPQQAAQALTNLWPESCSTVVSAGGIYPATAVERYQAFEVLAGGGSYPLVLRFDEGTGALALRQTCTATEEESGNCKSGTLNGAYPYTASFSDGYGLLTFQYQTSDVTMEVTLLEFAPAADAITLPQLVEVGDSALMWNLVGLAIEDQVPANNGITPSGLAAEASSVQSQRAS
ncbi:MAG TPA: hypothetical protein VGM10_16170 [Actinocrinis sp.]|jgi:hypothetical protein